MGAACSTDKSAKKVKGSKNAKASNQAAADDVVRPGHLAGAADLNKDAHQQPQPQQQPNDKEQEPTLPKDSTSQPVNKDSVAISVDNNSKETKSPIKTESPQKEGAIVKIEAGNGVQKSLHTDPKEPIFMQNLYLIGIDSDNKSKIIKFNPQEKAFHSIEPPAGLEIFNLSGVVYLTESEIYITGGLDPTNKTFSNKAFLYSPASSSVKQLASFEEQRYAHISVVFRNKLFIIGGFAAGTHENETILKTCQTLDLTNPSATWTNTGGLNYPRACGFCIIYNDKLYIMGGYSGNAGRTKNVEVYNEATNSWDIADFKIPRGIEYAVACTADKDELHIIGGNVRQGVVRSNVLFNLRTRTFTSKRSMHKERVFHKALSTGSDIWIFGGEEEDTVEVYDIHRDEWKYSDVDYKKYVAELQSFAFASAPLVILSRQDATSYEPAQTSSPTDVRGFLFGDDKTPFIFELNFTKRFTTEKSLPSNLKLFGYQGVVSLEDGRYFLCGGLDQRGEHISKNAYIYNPDKNQAKKCRKCNHDRYTFNLVKKGHYVYVLGGRSWGEDHEALLADCERYDLENDVWETLPSLNHPRCSGMSFVLGDQIVIVGGYKGNCERWENAEILDEAKGVWNVVELPNFPGIEGAGVLRDPRDHKSLLIFEGRTSEAESQKIWKITDELKFQEIPGQLKDTRSLAKVCAVDNKTVCLLGGEKMLVEFFDLEKGESANNEFAGQIENAITKAIFIDGRIDKSLIRFGLA